MSNYMADAINPRTGEIEQAIFCDDYFGKHRYGVRFPSDGPNAPTYGEDEIAADIPVNTP